MRLGPRIVTTGAFALAGLLCWFAATLAAGVIEERSTRAVASALADGGHDWAEIHADGLEVHLGGTAPSEAARFAALSTGGRVVEPSRVIDGTTVVAATPITPPRFSMEILRNEDGVSLIGLVPASMDREAMAERIRGMARDVDVTDLLEAGDYPVPGGWVQAVNYGLDALSRLSRAKISIAPAEVSITAIGESREEQARLESALARMAPDGLRLALDISAPRPVITPFALRFLIDEDGARFDACAAGDAEGRDRILAAALEAGLEGKAACTLGLGQPVPDWPRAVEMGIAALAEIGAGTLTFRDTDVALVAAEGADPAAFDRAVGALESNLPDVFALTAVLPPAPDAGDEGPPPPEFTATRSREGQVALRGRLPTEMVHETVESLARARFGTEAVYMGARVAPAGLPEGWTIRVLAGLSALAEVDHGAVTVTEESLKLTGVSGNRRARDEIVGLLTEKLGEGAAMTLSVAYDERLDPLADIPTPQECIRRIEIILEARKITFAPGSTEVEGESAEVVDEIADVLRACRKTEMAIQIAGHTDSQGRESMNLELSEARAQSVLDALAARRVSVARITSKGYGETAPIADNDTEEGREANRRIEFRLLPASGEEAAAYVAPGAAETGEAPAGDDAAPDEAAEGAAEPAEAAE
jgi:OOP family OmpA-OmpF porin